MTRWLKKLAEKFMADIQINAPSGKYSVIINDNIAAVFSGFLDKHFKGKKRYFVTDSNVLKDHSELINRLRADGESEQYCFEASENNKSLQSLSLILGDMVSKKINRDSILIAIGGGITGDIAGFAAAVFARGISYVHIPTTLLAMVDSSIGGKTGVNHGGIKNITGAFHQPSAVFVYPGFLSTLPTEEKLCGWGEIVKYSLITGGDLFEKVAGIAEPLKIDDRILSGEIIPECIRIKGGIVEKDEKEASGIRKVLNLGHTFAHGIESLSGYQIKHGVAVLYGCRLAAGLSRKMNLMDAETYERIKTLIGKFSLPAKPEYLTFNSMRSVMISDKKNQDGQISFVLPCLPGEILPEIMAPENYLKEIIENGNF